MPKSQGDPINTAELEALMEEFPDWKTQFPDLYRELNPPRHYKSRKNKISRTDRVVQKRANTVPVSDYRATFRHHRTRPRSSKKPPPSPRDPNPPPMQFETNQRADFIPKGVTCRPPPAQMEDKTYKPPAVPLDTKTNYQKDFQGSCALPDIRRTAFEVTRSNMRKSSAKLSSITTTNEHYKQWVKQPALAFKELPCFTDSILYPSQQRDMYTTNGCTYTGQLTAKPEPAPLPQGNIKLEGSRHLDTTNGTTYRKFEGAEAAKKITHHPKIALKGRGKLCDLTQSKSDFPGYRDGQPKPVKAVQPPPASIDIKFDNSQCFETEQRKQYPGVDPRQHPPPQLLKQEEQSRISKDHKLETLTCQKLDYQPIDLKEVYIPRAKMQPSILHTGDSPKIQSDTTSSHFFRKWDVKPRVRWGDFHENHSYVPPVDSFDGKTTNSETFTGRSTEIPKCFRPDPHPAVTSGISDYNTVYSAEFQRPHKTQGMSKDNKKMLLTELQRRKMVALKKTAAEGRYSLQNNPIAVK